MYIVRISSRFGDTLQEAVTDLVKLFQICLERVDEYTKSIAGKTVKTADECRYILKDLPSFESDLEKLAIEVIDEVARIKTKGIS